MSEELTLYALTRDRGLRDELAVRHLPLVKFVARKLSNSLPAYIEIDDLVSWGSLGLLDALDKFDPGREVRFSTYAVTRIRGAILDGLQQMDWAPKQVTSQVRALRRLKSELTNELGCEPSVEELAERANLSPLEIRATLVHDASTRVRPLDAPGNSLGNVQETTVGDSVAETRAWEADLAGEISELRNRMAVAINGLGERERAVLTLYYRDGKTLRQIAEELGVSVSSATQAHTHLVENVRERLAILGGVAC